MNLPGRWRFRLTGGSNDYSLGHGLGFARGVSIDGDTFAFEFVGESVDLIDLIDSGVAGEIDGFGYSVVGELLKRRLYP